MKQTNLDPMKDPWNVIKFHCKNNKVDFKKLLKTGVGDGLKEILKDHPNYTVIDIMAMIASFSLFDIKNKKTRIELLETIVIAKGIENQILEKKK